MEMNQHQSYEQGYYTQNRTEDYRGYDSRQQAMSDGPQATTYHYDGPQQQQFYTSPIEDSAFMHSHSLVEKGNVAAGLCYVGLWLTGLLFLLFEHKNRLVRFHAMQSLLFFGGVNVLYIVLINIMVHHVPFIFGFAIFAFVVMNIVAFVGWIVGMMGAFAGTYRKLPFVGDIAERYANSTSGATVK
jgi:uncharacterized membrane protein